MLPQDRFVFEYIYISMYHADAAKYTGRKATEKLMEAIGLQYRNGKVYIDLLKATNRNLSTDKSIAAWLDNAAERVDKVLTINWARRYATQFPGRVKEVTQ